MKMTLLERLASKTPGLLIGTKDDPLYLLVKRDIAEVIEARKRMYTWRDIAEALRANYIEEGKWRDDWRLTMIQRRCEKAMKEAQNSAEAKGAGQG